VIVPALPGGLSAFGILVSDIVKHYSRTVLWRATDKLPTQLQTEFSKLKQSAQTDFRQEHWRGRILFDPSIDVRYRGQGYELNVPFTPKLLAAFHNEHKRRYGYSHPEREVELVTLRLRARMKSSQADIRVRMASTRSKTAPESGEVVFNGKRQSAKIYDRDRLRVGQKYVGPAVVTEYSATTAIPPGMSFVLDRAANLVITTK
jgi:N-methylhydantoinase A